MTKSQLKLAGAMLYACEGTKARNSQKEKSHWIYAIELTNSKPEIIALFCKFLREILAVDSTRVRGQLFLYPDYNIEKLKNFWSRRSGIPKRQFQKVILLKQKNSKYKPNELGTFKIRYNHKVDFFKLQEMIANVWRSADV